MFNPWLISCVCLSLLALPAWGNLTIEGLSPALTESVKAHLPLAEEPCDAPHWRVQQRRRALPAQVTEALQSQGYYQARLQQQFSSSDSCWQLVLTIEPGERVQLRRVDITAADLPPDAGGELAALLAKPTLVPGQGLEHGRYDSFKSALLDAARAQGFWRAAYSRAELAIYPLEQAADVHLQLLLGPRYRFGAYQFSATPLSESLLLRLAGDLEGQDYSADQLQEVYSRLQSSGYFRQVLVRPEPERADAEGQIPLLVDLAMASETSLGVGVGYSTDRGPRLSGSYRNRWFNDQGHHWRIDSLASSRLQELGATYTIPGQDAAREWYELSGGWVGEETVSYTTRATTGRLRSVSALPSEWMLNSGVNLRNETWVVGDDAPAEETWLIVPSVGVSWLDAPNDVRQRRGLRLEAELSGSSQYWLSDVDYVQLQLRAKWISPVGQRGRLLLRGELASTLKDAFDELPPSVRFFTGGDNSVRGYAYNAIGTRDANGDVVGGSQLAVLSAEYDYLFQPNWSLSVFFDAGDAYDETIHWYRGAGVGLRWYSPVGPLRLDVASPLDREPGQSSYRIHLAVGADL